MFCLRNKVFVCYFNCELRRFASNEVRVRFAPSPTGHLHLGGLRTALYNYLFASHYNGNFILRIEDTDQTRLVPGAIESLVSDLQWAGINIDEGPGSQTRGRYGPYIQSERSQIYLNHVNTLLENGSAYHCFCTERRLELLRKEALRSRQVPKYDNKCRNLSGEVVSQLLDKETPFCIRFKLSKYDQPLNDLIYGRINHHVHDMEGDPIIIKTDKFPTYHFANVVDDHLMRVTHVLRGVEWQISTVKHLLLYKAFGWQPPEFGHLPLLINKDGTKLSKRQGDVGIKSFRDKGYFPIALLNYVVSAGGGFPSQQHRKPIVYSLPQLAERFSIQNVNTNPSRLNPDLLEEFNRQTITNLLINKSTCAQLVEGVINIIRKSFPNEKNLDVHENHVKNVLHWAVTRLTKLQDLTSPNLSFLWVRPSNYKMLNIDRDQLNLLIEMIENEQEFTKYNINVILKKYSKAQQIKFPIFMKSLRSALCGLKEGPGVAEMMEILGKRVVIERLMDATEENDTRGYRKHGY